MPSFHGKIYKRRFKSEYIDFLVLIRQFLTSTFQGLYVCALASAERKLALQAFGAGLLDRSLQQAEEVSPDAKELLAPYIIPLLQLASVASTLGPNVVMNAEIDYSDEFKDKNMDHQVCKIAEVPTSGHMLMNNIYNRYVDQEYARAPRLLENGVSTMKDEKSFLIQAADVLGSYSMAFARAKIGLTSGGIDAKAEIIQAAFGSYMPAFDFSSFITAVGPDLILNYGRAELIFRAGWTVKGPNANTKV